MPFERPSLGKLIARAQADMSGRLPGTDPLLRRNLVAIIARMSAGTAHGLYGYLDWLALQLMPDTAETENILSVGPPSGASRASPPARLPEQYPLPVRRGLSFPAGPSYSVPMPCTM